MAHTEQLHMDLEDIGNPYKPGAGHMPPHLAGRDPEQEEFRLHLDQETILENVVLTGLRGVGKTVLLETFKPIAQVAKWLWVGTDMSEAVSVSEERLSTRLLADLSVVTSGLVVKRKHIQGVGFASQTQQLIKTLDFEALTAIFRATPGLVEDKLKNVLELAWSVIQTTDNPPGVIFAYDEAQNLSDNRMHNEFPLSILLDVFQSIQKKGVPFMLVLTGLPTLIPKLVEARTYSERMFRVIQLDKLDREASRAAITVPIAKNKFICREVYDVFLQDLRAGRKPASVPMDAIIRKLDQDFFAGRWGNCSDRQRELLWVIAHTLDRSDGEVAIQDLVTYSKELLNKGFSPSHANQILAALIAKGLVYKNRHGRYSLAVPLLDRFILRQDFAAVQRSN